MRWAEAAGTTNWQFATTLEQGTNRISAFAVDTSQGRATSPKLTIQRM